MPSSRSPRRRLTGAANATRESPKSPSTLLGRRRRGVGRIALAALIESAQQAGYWKLVSRIFPENQASRALIRSLGFREVGIYEKHGKLDGIWRDVVIVERLIDVNLTA